MSGLGPRPASLAQTARWVLAGRLAADRAVKEFVYAFASMSGEARGASLVEEPPLLADPVRNAIFAAVAETLALRFQLAVPAWVSGESRYLKKPWYAGNLERIKPILLVESPSAFRIRNLFVSANALDRPGFELAINEVREPIAAPGA